MPKQLLLMRHAKSSWADPGAADFDRPLNKRGWRVAPQMAELLAKENLLPDRIVSSAAVRARQTAELFVEHGQLDPETQLTLTKNFYHAHPKVYLDYLFAFNDESVQRLMFVGHNPGLEDLAEQLARNWQAFPTAAVAHFDLGVDDWSEVQPPLDANLVNFWAPKDVGIF